MSKEPYTPVIGTIPHRTIEWLKTLPQGAERSTAEIAEYLEHDANGLGTILKHAVKHGHLKSRKQPGIRTLYWSLGNGVPPPKPDDHEEDEPLQRRSKPVPADTASASPFRLGDAIKANPPAPPSPEQKPRNTKLPEPKSKADQALKFWMCSDGTVTIRKGSQILDFAKDEADKLCQFLAWRTPQ